MRPNQNQTGCSPLIHLRPLCVLLLAFALILRLTGCAAEKGTQIIVKERGVYTTLAMSGNHLDLPGSGYTAWNSFGPSQTPTAVVLGFGERDAGGIQRPQPFELQVVEPASGVLLLTTSGTAFCGRAAVLDLPIRKTGHYRVKLIIHNDVFDTWDFEVNRDSANGTTAGATPAPAYAEGVFGVNITSSLSNEILSQYDPSLNRALLNAVREETYRSNREIFAQLPPGKVVVQLSLTETGAVSSVKITNNTLTDPVGEFFLRAIRQGAPYATWPPELRAALGSAPLTLEVSFRYD